MKIVSNKRKQELWLDGPQGNVFVLLGVAQNITRQIGGDWSETEKILKKDGTYAGIVREFDKLFGDIVELKMSRQYARAQGIKMKGGKK